MAELLTNASLASILHLIRHDLARNRRVPPRRAPPRWVPPRWDPARRLHRRPQGSGPRAVTPPPQYRSMELSPPIVPEQSLPGPPLPPFDIPYTPRSQVDLGQLVGPPKGATLFMVVGLVRAPATEEQERGLPMVEPLTRGTADLTISDRPATPYHRADPTSPTPDGANPNPNGLGSGSPPRLSPLGNRIICRVIRLPTSTHTRLIVDHPGAFTDVSPSDSTVRRVRFHH
jgi:hypothetical protein